MPPKNSGGLTKFPGGHKVIHRTAQTAFVRVVTPRLKRLDTAHPSVIVYMLCIVQETFLQRSTNSLQILVFGLFETFDIIQFIGQIEASSFNSWALDTFAVPGEGNLMIRVFRGMGNRSPRIGEYFFFSWPISSVAKGAHNLSFELYLKVYLFIYFYGSCFEYMEMLC